MLALLDKYKGSDKYDFANKVEEVSYKLGISPQWLMFVLWSESGLDPHIKNKIGCVGIFQFCSDYGTPGYKVIGGQRVDLEWLRNQSGAKQLDYVYDYLFPYHIKGQLQSYFDLYLITFFPAAVGQSDNDNYVFQGDNISAQDIAHNNPTMDFNKDGQVTMGEFKKWLENRVLDSGIADQYHDIFFSDEKLNPAKRNILQMYQRELTIGSVTIVLLVVLWVAFKKIIY